MRNVMMIAALCTAGCSKPAAEAPAGEKAPATAAGGAPAAVAGKADKIQAFLADNTKALTPELYEKLVVALASCTVTDDGIDSKCQAKKDLEKARNRNTAIKDLLGASGSIGKRHIGDASPAVRLQSAQMMGSVFGSDGSSQAVIAAAAAKESEAPVLRAMLNVVGSRHKGNDAVKDLLLKSAAHENEKVRIDAMGWFLTRFGEGVPGTFDKVMEHLEKDPSVKVRAYLCSRLFGSYDERALKLFDKHLGAKDTPPELFDGCWNGVIGAWTGFPFPDKPQKRAYELTMKVLGTKPRSQTRPPWSGISTLRAAKSEFKPDDSFGLAWQGKVKGWYKKEKLIAALETVAGDEQAHWMARTAALDVMQQLGAPKGPFEKLATRYADVKSGDNVHVKRRAEESMKKIDAGGGAP